MSFGSGFAIGYLITSVAYGFGRAKISFVDSFTDNSIFGSIKFAIIAAMGIYLFPVHFVMAIIGMVKGEI